MAVALALAGCGAAAPPPTATVAINAAPPINASSKAIDTTMARYDGYGELRFGMDEKAFEQAWAGKLKGAATPDSDCFYKLPVAAATSRDFGFMFARGRFVRYDVGSAMETAPGGGKVGMSETQIRALYGTRVEAQPHKYVDGANYLRVAAPEGDGVLLFETDAQGKVVRWRVGVPPQVDYVEGCG